jgi:16S rRNA (uracil1498-N3)-methyltransferase
MQLPFFFEENLPAGDEFYLSEESSRHIVQVLRMHEPDELIITNGNGETLTAFIVSPDKRKTAIKITARTLSPQRIIKISVGISLIKNKNRFEWFLEKATEVGVSEIIPMICHRTEKQHFNYDRVKNILVSAMLQSQQPWLPSLHAPVKFSNLLKESIHPNKYIAHCMAGQKSQLPGDTPGKNSTPKGDSIILIGPEGDFINEEVDMAMQHNFMPVTLGETRLRTETAGLVAAVLLLNK